MPEDFWKDWNTGASFSTSLACPGFPSPLPVCMKCFFFWGGGGLFSASASRTPRLGRYQEAFSTFADLAPASGCGFHLHLRMPGPTKGTFLCECPKPVFFMHCLPDMYGHVRTFGGSRYVFLSLVGLKGDPLLLEMCFSPGVPSKWR